MEDYRIVKLSTAQSAIVMAGAAAALFGVGFLFYRSAIISLLLSSGCVYAPKAVCAILVDWRRKRLRLQFREALYSISTSLATGRSLESAVSSVPEDLAYVYPDPSTEIRVEFAWIREQLRNGESLERSLSCVAIRSGLEDIHRFAECIAAAKRTGGDLVSIVRSSSRIIGEKLEVEEEIAVIVARKRLESRLMLLMPAAFMLFLSWTAPDYMAPLWSGYGYVVVTAALLVLAACAWVVQRMLAFEV